MLIPTATLPLALFENLFDGPDILIVLAIALIFFGNRLPSVAKSLGRSIVEFKNGMAGSDKTSHAVVDAEKPAEHSERTDTPYESSGKQHHVKEMTRISEEP
jgi:sec-independent protein translocase protein TatA